MTGAIEFMRAWRNICLDQIDNTCDECPIVRHCPNAHQVVIVKNDEDINGLISDVMAEKRRKENG